jgi:hypothetical protein
MDDEVFDDLFPDELRHDQVRDLCAALERRLAAARRGDLELSAEEQQTLATHLAVLRQEEAISAFVERSVAEALALRDLRDSLGEGGEG